MAKRLEGIGGRKQKRTGKGRVLSLPDAIAKSLHEHMRYYSGEKARAKDSAALAAAVAAATAAAATTENNSNNNSRRESMGPTYSSGSFAELSNMVGDLCPDCGNSTLLNTEGCKKCYICGHSEC